MHIWWLDNLSKTTRSNSFESTCSSLRASLSLSIIESYSTSAVFLLWTGKLGQSNSYRWMPRIRCEASGSEVGGSCLFLKEAVFKGRASNPLLENRKWHRRVSVCGKELVPFRCLARHPSEMKGGTGHAIPDLVSRKSTKEKDFRHRTWRENQSNPFYPLPIEKTYKENWAQYLYIYRIVNNVMIFFDSQLQFTAPLNSWNPATGYTSLSAASGERVKSSC